jgi:hypothetical protein
LDLDEALISAVCWRSSMIDAVGSLGPRKCTEEKGVAQDGDSGERVEEVSAIQAIEIHLEG